jgi:hypothetical protein
VPHLQTNTVCPLPTPVAATNADPKGAWRVPAAIITVAGALFYANSFKGVFVFDDKMFISENPAIQHLWPPWQALLAPANVNRPLIGLSDAINYSISGLSPWSYHALNLVIHIVAALALYGIVRRTLLTERLNDRFGKRSNILGLIVALIWLAHPLQTQSVTYVIQRCESMMGMFYLVCLYCSIRSHDSKRRPLWYAAAIAACAGGMLSKQVMVTAPLIVLLYDVVFSTQSPKQAIRARWPLYVGLAGTWAVLAATIIAAPVNATAGFAVKTVSSWDYFKTELGVIVYYLRLSIWPNPLCLDYLGWHVAKTIREVAPYAIILGGLGIATVWALLRRRPEGFLGAWFFLILSLTSSVMPFSDLVFEHRMYLPLAAVVAFVVLGFYALAGRVMDTFHVAMPNRRIAANSALAMAAIVVVALGIATVRRNSDYRSEVVMWSDIVRQRPDNPRGQYNLGTAFYTDGRLLEAKEHLQDAIALDPGEAKSHYNLGGVLSDLGQTNDAANEFASAVRLKPDYAEAYLRLGFELEKAGRIPDAKEQYRLALHLRPDWTGKVSAHLAGLKE